MRSIVHDITAPWPPLVAWLYDLRAADPIARLADPVLDDLRALPAGSSVLDVGCGGGQQAMTLAAEGYRVTGVDLSATMIRRADARAARHPDLAHPPLFHEADATALPFPDHHFDGVSSVGSIKHWSDPVKGLAECLRVLAPGGTLVIAEVDRGCRMPDVWRWIGQDMRIPCGFRTLGVMAFRTWVAGPSLDLADAGALLDGLGLLDGRVERLEGTPLWTLRGRKPPSAGAPP